MSRLRELIAKLCPDGVEYRALGEVGTFTKGRGLQKKDFSETGIGCIHYGQIYTRLGIVAIEPLTYVSPEKAPGFTWVEPNDIVIAVTSENVDDVCKAVVWRGKDRIVTGVHAVVFHPFINSMYVAYYLQTRCFNQQKIMIVDGVKVIEMKIDRLAKIRIPVPPIEVQREIVRILDAFQELDDALTAEIEAREKQLDAIRDRVYSDSAYPKTKLGDIGRFERGKRFTRSQMGGNGVPCIHYGDIYTKCKYWTNEPIDRLTDDAPATLRYASRGDVVIASTSENAEDVCAAIVWDCDERAAVHDDCQIFHHEQNPLYMALFFNSEPFAAQKMRFVTESKVVRISGAEMAQTIIPLPPASVQDRIAQNMADDIHLLDCLRSEREARRKQFAYYRDKLLAFPKRPREVDE